MKDNTITWIIVLILFVALGFGTLIAYDMMNTAVESYFFT